MSFTVIEFQGFVKITQPLIIKLLYKDIPRTIERELKQLSKDYPVITLTGPRQSGKTTLVRKIFDKLPYYSLESPDTRMLIKSDPRAILNQHKNGLILDEIQLSPELLSYIQEIVDLSVKKPLFVLTGSNQFSLMSKITQSLAGRTAIFKLLPLSIEETHSFSKSFSTDDYLIRGFYPAIYSRSLDPLKAYRNYYETYIERDIRQLINIKDLSAFQTFVRLCAGRIGNLFNASNLANETGVSAPTIKSWMSILETAFTVFLLPPYFENINKRLIKSPKIYFYDVGLVCYLLGIENINQLSRDPARGALFENLILMEIVKQRFNNGLDHNLFFYRDSHQNEIDVICKQGRSLIPVEIKSAQTYNEAFLKNLKYIKNIFPQKIEKLYLLYDGDLEQESITYNILNYRSFIKSLG